MFDAGSEGSGSIKDLNNQHHDQPLLTNYFLASSPLSSSSSLSESNTLIGENGGLNSHGSSRHGSTASSPTGHVSNGPSSASLPHKLRHKLQQTSSHSHRGNDCENAVIESGSSVVMRGQGLTGNSLRGSGERESEESGKQLKEENYTLRNELQRLATEVASLRTILLPIDGSANGQQQEFSSSPSHHHNQAHDEERPQDQDMDTSSEKGSTSALED